MVYVDHCKFLSHLQYNIDKIFKFFKEDGPSYNLEHSKGYPVSEIFDIYNKTFIDGGFNYPKNVLKDTGMELCNYMPTSNRIEAPLEIDKNYREDNRDFPNSYYSDIGIMLSLMNHKNISIL